MKWRTLISFVLAVVLLAACRRDAASSVDELPTIGITLIFPEYDVTKADTTVPASAEENKVNNLVVWIFTDELDGENQPVHALVADPYVIDTHNLDDFPQAGGGAKRYAIPVDWEFALDTPFPKLAVFVMANITSFGLSTETVRTMKTWDAVYNASFGSTDLFSPESLTTDVPDGGLPMSGFRRNLKISGHAPSLSVESVTLERAVSKVRFVMCQLKTEDSGEEVAEDFILKGITLNGNQIPEQEYIFTEGGARVGDSYSANPLALVFNPDYDNPSEDEVVFPIRPCESPEDYMYGNIGGAEYENLITQAIGEGGDLTHCGTYYLRESDLLLKGVISYQVKKGDVLSSAKNRQFDMASGTDFSRNHSWTVYGYYITNRILVLSVHVEDWRKGDYVIDFSKQSLMVTQKFTVLSQSVQSITPTLDENGNAIKKHYDVYLKKNSPAQAYIYVATPEGGELHMIPSGDYDDFTVTPRSQTINPHASSGRINIEILGTGNPGKSITIGFAAYTMGGEVKIPGESECVDQVYHFIIPVNN